MMFDPQAAAQLAKPVMVPPVGVVCIAAVQVKVLPASGVLELKAMIAVPALQMVWAVAEPTGTGLTVKSTVNGVPEQVCPPLV